MSFRGIAKAIVPAALRARLRSFKKRNGTQTYFEQDFLGERLSVFDGDGLSRGWYGHGWPVGHRKEFEKLKNLSLPNDSIIFNFGAHQGVIALLLKRLIAPNGKVIAVEMDGFNSECIRKNIRINDESDISVLAAAVSNQTGYARASGGKNNALYFGKASFLAPRVRTVSFKDVCFEYGTPNLVYCDIEGAEVFLFSEPEEVLFKVEAFFIEMHGDESCERCGHSQQIIIDSLYDRGYRLFGSRSDDEEFIDFKKFQGDLSDRFFLIASKQINKQY